MSLIEQLKEMAGDYAISDDEDRIAMANQFIARGGVIALVLFVEAADDLRDYPTHPEFLEADHKRRDAYDAARSALERQIGGKE